jgi:hypothetical protein
MTKITLKKLMDLKQDLLEKRCLYRLLEDQERKAFEASLLGDPSSTRHVNAEYKHWFSKVESGNAYSDYCDSFYKYSDFAKAYLKLEGEYPWYAKDMETFSIV